MVLIKQIFIAFLCLLFAPNLLGQELENVRKNITGTWELDLQSTNKVFETLKDQLPEYRQKEISQFMEQIVSYIWEINIDGTSTSKIKLKDKELPTQSGTWKIENASFTERELKLVGSSTVFDAWANKESGVNLTIEKDGMWVIRASEDELIIFDVGSPQIFKKTKE